MTSYRVGIGHDLALGALADIVPQPRTDSGILTLRNFSDAGAREQRKHCVLRWNVLGSRTLYTELLEQFSLETNLTSAVTLYIKDEVFNWNRYNGYAVQPQFGENVEWSDFFVREISIYVHSLELLA